MHHHCGRVCAWQVHVHVHVHVRAMPRARCTTMHVHMHMHDMRDVPHAHATGRAARGGRAGAAASAAAAGRAGAQSAAAARGAALPQRAPRLGYTTRAPLLTRVRRAAAAARVGRRAHEWRRSGATPRVSTLLPLSRFSAALLYLTAGSALLGLYFLPTAPYQVRLLTATLLIKLAHETPTALLLAHGQAELCTLTLTLTLTLTPNPNP